LIETKVIYESLEYCGILEKVIHRRWTVDRGPWNGTTVHRPPTTDHHSRSGTVHYPQRVFRATASGLAAWAVDL